VPKGAKRTEQARWYS